MKFSALLIKPCYKIFVSDTHARIFFKNCQTMFLTSQNAYINEKPEIKNLYEAITFLYLYKKKK